MELSLYTPIIRIILYNICGALLAKGYMDEGLIEPVIGATLGLITFAWTYYSHKKTNKIISVALSEPQVVKELVKDAADEKKEELAEAKGKI